MTHYYLASQGAAVVRNLSTFALLDTLKDEAALEVSAAFDGISGKRIDSAALGGFGRHGISRAINGCETNPLYRLAGIFLLMKRLGLGRERAQRLVDWLQSIVDSLWGPEESQELGKVLDRDAEMDPRDDHARLRASHGCVQAAKELLECTREQMAYKPTVVAALRRRIAEG